MGQINMAKATLKCFCILISLNLISTAEVHEKSPEEKRKRPLTDPVSNFFSNLGNLFLDIDETFTAHTGPKVEYEGLVDQILRPSNEYFGNVQENYRALQKRLGTFVRKSLTPKGVYTDRDLSTIEPPKHEDTEKAVTPTHSPRMKVGTFKEIRERKNPSQPPSSMKDDIDNGECSLEIINNPFLDPHRRDKCSQSLKRHVYTDDRLKKSTEKALESRLKNQYIPIDPRELDTYPFGFFRRDGDFAELSTEPQGRILGDVLYSESFFDRNVRQLLRDHGKWILDNPLLTRWRKGSTEDNSDVATEASTTETDVTSDQSSSDITSEEESTLAYIPITAEFSTEIPVFEETYSENQLPLQSDSYYRLLNNDGVNEEEVDIVISHESNPETVLISETDEYLEEKLGSEGFVILAFTPNGVPLKLRIGPEIENPYRFLHKALKSAGVSLNVPVESHDNIEPAGKEVLNFGAGVLTRPVYFDLSDTDELKALLKTLMKSKVSETSKF